MPKLTEAEEAQLAKLAAQKKEAEEELEKAEKETKEAEKEKRKAVEEGAKPKTVEKKEEEVEIARASESSIHALLEQTSALMSLLEETLRSKGVDQKRIDEAKNRRKIVRT